MITKPELEAGNYIAYADEPNTVVSGSGGGGGVVVIESVFSDKAVEMLASYNELFGYFDSGKACYLHIAEGVHSIYGAFPITNIEHPDSSYKAAVFWAAGDNANIVRFESDSADANLVWSMQ